LARSDSKADIVEKILDYADQKGKMKTILAWAKAENLSRYERHGPYIQPPEESQINIPVIPHGLDETDIQIARDILSAFFRDTSYFSGSFSKDVLNELHTAGGFTSEQARQLQRYFVQTGELNLGVSDPRKVFTSRQSRQKKPLTHSPIKESANTSGQNQRCIDLVNHIQEAFDLIKQYEEKRRLTSDPKVKRQAEREISSLREQLSEYEAEARELGCE
jgi:hypothetical protein